MINLYVTLSDATLRQAEEFTEREQDPRAAIIVPGSKRVISAAEQARSSFWNSIDAAKPARVLHWRRG